MPAEFRSRVDSRGIWHAPGLQPVSGSPRPALFLDRDGTLIEHVPYLSSPDGVRPIGDALAAVRRANELKIPVVVVTNQSGIGYGYFDWREFAAVEEKVALVVAAGGGRLDGVYACPHLPDQDSGRQSRYRKPAPGMLLCAARDLNLDLAKSWIAGDSVTDIVAGRRAGVCLGWLVPTGNGSRDAEQVRALARPGFDVVIGRDLAALARRLDDLARMRS